MKKVLTLFVVKNHVSLTITPEEINEAFDSLSAGKCCIITAELDGELTNVWVNPAHLQMAVVTDVGVIPEPDEY